MNLYELNEAVNKAFRQAFKEFSNILAIRAEQTDAPIPDEDVFASVKVQTTGTSGWDQRTYENKGSLDLIETVCGRRLGIASISIFNKQNTRESDNPMDIGQVFKIWLQGAAGIEFMQRRGIGIGSIGNPLDVTAIEQGQYEARANMTIDFNVKVELISTVTEIQSVIITGSVEDAGESIPVNLQISE